MSVEAVDPEGIVNVGVHHQVTIGRGSRIVSMAGQVSWDAGGRLVGADDLAAQTEQAYLNVATALEAAGATTEDLIRATLYVVQLSPEKLEQVCAGMQRAAQRLGVRLDHPGTYIGVMSLFDPAYLIEIEATAVID